MVHTMQLQLLLPPIIAESPLITLANGSPSSLGPEWSVPETKRKIQRQTENRNLNISAFKSTYPRKATISITVGVSYNIEL